MPTHQKASAEQIAAAAHVTCPACGRDCLLIPLERGGSFRLADPDGWTHEASCPSIAKRLVRTSNWGPQTVAHRTVAA
jgi:hypothetical protein